MTQKLIAAYDFYAELAGRSAESASYIDVPAEHVTSEFDLHNPKRTWRDAVAIAALRLHDGASGECSTRIDKAKAIVLDGGVTHQPGQPAQVRSHGDEAEIYVVHEDQCTCPDYAHSQAPLGSCKHRLALRLHRQAVRIARELHDLLGGTVRQQVIHQYPEAPVSINMRGRFRGRDTQVTLRHWDPNVLGDMMSVADGSLDRALPVAEPGSGSSMQTPAVPPCPVHGIEMRESSKKGVRYYCPKKTGERTYCDQIVPA